MQAPGGGGNMGDGSMPRLRCLPPVRIRQNTALVRKHEMNQNGERTRAVIPARFYIILRCNLVRIP